MSCQPCGCDPEAGHVCMVHAEEVMRDTTPAIREFATGATRNVDASKADYDGFLSPLVIERFGEYMNKHRLQANGVVRDSDNWQKGIPKDAYMKSGWRHFFDWWKVHRSLGGDLEEAICALMFNAQGYLHEHLKDNHERTGSVRSHSNPLPVQPTSSGPIPIGRREEGLPAQCHSSSPQADGDGGQVGTPEQDRPQPPVHPLGHHRVVGHDGAFRRADGQRPSVDTGRCGLKPPVDVGGLFQHAEHDSPRATPTSRPTFPSTSKHDSWWEHRNGELVRVR